tara:strand:- start:1612 stop:1893 length:282 start_codon:yes stop_codon:yes gene_type:complete
MRLELSRKAQADLAEIRDYTAGRFGAEQSIAYLDAIEEAFRRLLAFPMIGATAVGEDVRAFGCRQHRIYYVGDDERVLVVRVLHKAMDVGRRV